MTRCLLARVEQLARCIDFSSGGHAYGMDTYPFVSSSSDLSPVAKNVENCLDFTPPTKPVFAVLQGQANSEYSGTPTGMRPSRVASRYMAYSAIIHGANGLFWGWGLTGSSRTLSCGRTSSPLPARYPS